MQRPHVRTTPLEDGPIAHRPAGTLQGVGVQTEKVLRSVAGVMVLALAVSAGGCSAVRPDPVPPDVPAGFAVTSASVDDIYDRLDSRFVSADPTALGGAVWGYDSGDRGEMYLFDTHDRKAEPIGLPIGSDRTLGEVSGLVTAEHVAVSAQSCVGSTHESDSTGSPECDDSETSVRYTLDLTDPSSVLAETTVAVTPHCESPLTQSTLTLERQPDESIRGTYFDAETDETTQLAVPPGWDPVLIDTDPDRQAACTLTGRFAIGAAEIPDDSSERPSDNRIMWDLQRPEDGLLVLPYAYVAPVESDGIILMSGMGYRSPDTTKHAVGDRDGVANVGPLLEAVPVEDGFLVRAEDRSWWRLTRA